MPSLLKIFLLLILTFTGLMLASTLDSGTAGPERPAYSADALNSLLASMLESRVDTGSSEIRLQGVALAGEEWTRSLEEFRNSVADGIILSMNVFVVDTALQFNELCSRMFTELIVERVSFGQSGTEIRDASRPMLDRIADFSRDCQQSTISITGHTDNTGNETYNKTLSRARAQAVADYLLERGATVSQLHVGGAGSEFPIADNATPQGREQNRRIDFELRTPP
jgi:outer membrane protein OmpA-like peptidoglycan-associated protein